MSEPYAPKGSVAIIGMSCLFPGAPDLESFWHTVLNGIDSVGDVPSSDWDARVYFDSSSQADDRLYTRRGGYLGDLTRFDPVAHGVMPATVRGGEAEQFLSLQLAQQALRDAGYAERPFPRDRTEVILGRGSTANRGSVNYAFHTYVLQQVTDLLRNLHPEYREEELAAIKQALKANLPPIGPEAAATLIPNYTSGRVSSRLDLMGVNYTVDAACASALIGVELAMRDLRAGHCDLAIVGAVHLANHVPFLAAFCQVNALSRRSEIRPFDAEADGTLPGEGVGMVVLKRCEDAERDGDRIYAVLRGSGSSSDGRGQGPMAPRLEGEVLALRRAYEAAGVHPETVAYVETHGTATPLGDQTEVQALAQVFGPRQGALPTCGLSTVKSMIGHLMPAAGIAGLIRAALSLYHKTLPPSLHCDRPSPRLGLETTPFYINTEARPWIHASKETPRRAGVSAFGFGGVNAHLVLEEAASTSRLAGPSRIPRWPTELLLFRGATPRALLDQMDQVDGLLERCPELPLRDLAYSLNVDPQPGPECLAVVAASVGEVRTRLSRARERLGSSDCRQIRDRGGTYYFAPGAERGGKVAFLFPGEAAQYPNMLRDLCLYIPEVRVVFDLIDEQAAQQSWPMLPGQYLFPVPATEAAASQQMAERLWQLGGALKAVMTADWALYNLLRRLDIKPDLLLGHSSGEYAALVASGALTEDLFLLERLTAFCALFEQTTPEGGIPRAALVAAAAGRAGVLESLGELSADVHVAMDNCPHQIVLSVPHERLEAVVARLQARGVLCQQLPFDRPYHTPLFRQAADPLGALFEEVVVSAPEIEVFSCATAAPYPRALEAIRDTVTSLSWSRVEFPLSVEALYSAGARIFVEIGPRGNLTAFVEDILRGRPHIAVASDQPRRHGITQLNHLLGILAAQGVPMRLDFLYADRGARHLDLDGASDEAERSGRSNVVTLSLALPSLELTEEQARSVRQAAGASRANIGAPLPGEVVSDSGVVTFSSDLAPASNTEVMQDHLRTMEQFLRVEQEVMEAFLRSGAGPAEVEALADQSLDASPSHVEHIPTEVSQTRQRTHGALDDRWPLLGEIVSHLPGKEILARRRLDPGEDAFLRDHAFGRQVSAADPTLTPLAVVPFTICLEMMAEAASCLADGRMIATIEEIEARQWMEVAAVGELEIRAVTHPDQDAITVEASMTASEDGSRPAVTVAKAIVHFGDRPPPPDLEPTPLQAEQPCPHSTEEMYRRRMTFHGPAFQTLIALDATGSNGIRVRARATAACDRSPNQPGEYLLEPFLLDATGQAIGYWIGLQSPVGHLLFPTRLERVELYGVQPVAGEDLRIAVEILEVTARRIRAEVQLAHADGTIWARLSGWEGWRFQLPAEFCEYFVTPLTSMISESYPLPLALWSVEEPVVCRRLEPVAEISGAIAQSALAGLILSRAERQELAALSGPARRRAEWLWGRAAAKDAVRELIARHHGLELLPADVEIGADQDGRPVVNLLEHGDGMTIAAVSISHSGGVAVALASLGRQPGIDIERIQPRGREFLEIAFSTEELALIGQVDQQRVDEVVARFWCAKEAVGKAFGTGLVPGPTAPRVVSLDLVSGRTEVLAGSRLAERLPDLEGKRIVVQTVLDGEWIVAATMGESE